MAVPDTKNSSVMYGNASTCTASGTTAMAGSGYIRPGPATAPDMVGTGGVAPAAGRTMPGVSVRATSALIKHALDFITPGL